MAVGDRFVQRHDAARTSTANATAADISYDTGVINEGYTWSSPEVTVPDSGLYLNIFDVGRANLASSRACGTLVPAVNGTQQERFRATHRFLRNSGGALEGASSGICMLDLTFNDDVKVRNPGFLAPTVGSGSYATDLSFGGAVQLLRLPDGNYTHVERTVDAAECGISNINTTRPWVDSSGTWTQITFNAEIADDDSLYTGSGGDITLKANKKYAIAWGVTCWSSDSSRHTYVTRLVIDGNNVQSGSGYQRSTTSRGPPMNGLYLHEVGVSAQVIKLEATQETDGGDAGTPMVSHAYLQVIELPDSADWIHANNGATDSLTTALAGTTTNYATPLSNEFRTSTNLSLDIANDAVQNDSGSNAPVLAIGWHRWDRDTTASPTRKTPWSFWENDGSEVGYAIAGANSRGNQGSDSTWQAHYTSAALLDIANGTDLKFMVNDPVHNNNSDMGIYASTNQHFLGVQVLDLASLAGGDTIPPTLGIALHGA